MNSLGNSLPRMRRILGAAFISVALLAGVTQAARSDEVGPAHAIPAIVQRAASVYSSETQGVIGLQRHFETVIHAGPLHYTEKSDSGFTMRDGSYLSLKYYEVADDGKPFSPNELGSRETQTKRDWAAGKIFFKEPYDPRYIGDYEFSEVTANSNPSGSSAAATPACTGCPAGVVAVNFSSSIHDIQHGSGTMWIDPNGAHVVRLTYTPNQLPPHATSASLTEISTQAMPGLWYVTRIEGYYTGRKFLLRGWATFTGTFDHFARFESGSEAADALEKGTI